MTHRKKKNEGSFGEKLGGGGRRAFGGGAERERERAGIANVNKFTHPCDHHEGV
jgi:hypothetical protein